MRLFYVPLAGMLAIQNIRLARIAYPVRRWIMATLWICFSIMALTPLPKEEGAAFGLLLFGLLLVNYSRLLWILALAGPHLTTLLIGLFFRRRAKAMADLSYRFIVWMACSLRGRPLLIAYRSPSTLSDLIEAHLLPRVARRAIIIKNWSPQESHRFSMLDRMAVMSVDKLRRLPLIVRFRPTSAPRCFSFRKALWLCQNGRPAALERLVSAAFRGHRLTTRSSERRAGVQL